jgi:hypothetical protein
MCSTFRACGLVYCTGTSTRVVLLLGSKSGGSGTDECPPTLTAGAFEFGDFNLKQYVLRPRFGSRLWLIGVSYLCVLAFRFYLLRTHGEL